MNLFILLLAVIVGYPMFMMAVYLCSKGLCNQRREFSELKLSKKSVAAPSKKKNFTHA